MKRLLTISLSLLLSLGLWAQDVHFSQFYAAPIALNPSFTGSFDGLLRFGANYRNQWRSVTIPYKTFSFYTDVNLFRDKFRNGDWIGAGFLLINDIAGTTDLTTTKVSTSFAYHKSLSIENNFYLSAGISAMYINKKIDFSSLLFDSQWDDIGFNSNLNPNEPFADNSIHYFDLHWGVSLMYFLQDKFNFRVGFSMAHANAPKESFIGSENALERRPVAHLYGDIRITKTVRVHPGISFMTQKRARELLTGANAVYRIYYTRQKYVGVYFGLWYRNQDALYPLTGVEINRTRILFNFDMNLSKLQPASHTRGAVELSIVQIIDPYKERPTNISRQCPRF